MAGHRSHQLFKLVDEAPHVARQHGIGLAAQQHAVEIQQAADDREDAFLKRHPGMHAELDGLHHFTREADLRHRRAIEAGVEFVELALEHIKRRARKLVLGLHRDQAEALNLVEVRQLSSAPVNRVDDPAKLNPVHGRRFQT